MHKVVTINLNGNAYQLDESAFATLRAYLDQAEARLRNNPDRAEILADLEQAIAEKCARYLGAHKTVVMATEMDQVVAEMGPVDAGDDAHHQAASAATADAAASAEPSSTGRPGPKRLFRIREGAIFMGMCNGIAAYTHIDVVFVRIAFVVAIVLTFGWGFLGYWLLAFVIPEAQTADEHAAAHGQAPFNAQDVVDEARRAAENLKAHARSTRAQWRSQAREQRRQWRSQSRAWRRQWRNARWATPFPAWAAGVPVRPVMYPPPMWSAAVLPVLGIASFVCFLALAASILSLVDTGGIFGWPLPAGMPLWVGVLLLSVLFLTFTTPLRAARRAYRHGWGLHAAWFAMWDGVIGMAIVGFGFWMLFSHMPPTHNVHEFVQNVPDAVRASAHEIGDWFRRTFNDPR